jgi:23S rRNA pseudouridine2604 synthase
MENNLKRLNKFIGETGHCSRREADAIIAENRVTVNGAPAELGMKVSSADEIRIDGKLIVEKTGKFVYLAFNKPVGIECTTNTDVADNIIDYINYPKRIFPIGRLDKASEGLIFLTDDGDIVNKILRARNNHEKEYTVTVDKFITDRFIEKMSDGVPILDTVTRKCKVEQISKNTFKIILTQGLNRQIRRMCEYLGYEVISLKRIRIINISLDVPVGRYRELTEEEISQLSQLIETSDKTEVASLPKATRSEKTPDFEGPKRDYVRKEAPKRDIQKKDFKRNDFKREDSRPAAPKKEYPKTEQRQETPKRKIEFIKKEDPDYRKIDDLPKDN